MKIEGAISVKAAIEGNKRAVKEIYIDKDNHTKNFNYIREYYYSKSDIVDFDVLDYIEFEDFEKKDNKYVKVKAEIRVINHED